jgi:hypothetical protein
MEQATFADGVLSKKVKELTAVGISVVINCKSCMQRHNLLSDTLDGDGRAVQRHAGW